MARSKPPVFDPLTDGQQKALSLAAGGATLAQAAQELSLTPADLAGPVFTAAWNSQQKRAWELAQERLRALLPLALDALESDLKGEDPKARQAAAVHILRAVGLYGSDLTPKGPTNPHAIERQAALADLY